MGVTHGSYHGEVKGKTQREIWDQTDLLKVSHHLYHFNYFFFLRLNIFIFPFFPFLGCLFYHFLLSPLYVCGVSYTSFKYFRSFWEYYFWYPSIKCTDPFYTVQGMIDSFNKSCRNVSLVVEKTYYDKLMNAILFQYLYEVYLSRYSFFSRICIH